MNGQWEQFGTASAGWPNIGLDIIKWYGGYYGVMAGGEADGLFRLDGGDWVPFSTEVMGTCLPAHLAEFHGDLYIAGWMQMGAGCPGNNICRYDGQAFHALGMGLQSFPGNNNSVCGPSDMIAHGDLLFVAHSCNYAGGIPSGDIAAWDGERWCTVQGIFANGVSSMDFMGDTLYVGCGATVDGVPVGHAARYIGPDFTDSCGTVTFVPVTEPEPVALTAYPSPADGSITFTCSGANAADVHLHVLDALGRMVWNGLGPSHEVIVSSWGAGIFTAVATGRSGMVRRTRFMVR